MFGDYFLIITGAVAAAWAAATVLWAARNPGCRPPLILLASPLATGILSIIEGISRVATHG
jgi:hypothetical protein